MDVSVDSSWNTGHAFYRFDISWISMTDYPLPLLVNEARAMRVAEIMTDFRNLQHYLSQLQATPTAEEYYLEGYSLLRQCVQEAQAILQTPFAAGTTAAGGDPEQERQQLRG